MEKKSSSADAGADSSVDLLRDAEAPHSNQNPSLWFPSPFASSSAADLSSLSPQDAADRLFRNAEILAPMVRASTIPLRILALHHGADLVFTEELVDRSIFPTERIVNEELGTIDYRVPKHTYSLKVQKRMAADKDNPDSKDGAILLRIDPSIEKGKIIYQVGTGESNLALEATTKVVNDVSGIDVNMGCPKKFSVSGGMGSALLSDVKRACDIVSTLRRNIPKPVSAKIRLLDPEDPRPTIDFARSLIKAGANAITIHGRIVGDESHVNARWPMLVEVVKQLRQTEGVPIIVNGDLYTRADIREMKQRSGCDGVMLARPALCNVSIFRKKGGGEAAGCPLEEDRHDDVPLSQFQTANHAGYFGYKSPLLHPRTKIVQEYIAQCVRYRAHSKNAKYVVCEMMNSRRAPTSRVPFLSMEFEGGQTIQSVCKCRSLDDLVKIWDVKWDISLPNVSDDASALQRSTGVGAASEADKDGETPHRYDDRYFLDPDNFRRERKVAVNSASEFCGSSNLNEEGDEKKTDDGCDGSMYSGESEPTPKRTRLLHTEDDT